MLGLKFVLVFVGFVYASAYVAAKDAGTKSTTETPELKNRFFGLENILGQLFHGPNQPGFGGHFQHSPGFHNQQNPQGPYNNWQNVQYPNQAQSNLDQQIQSSPHFPQGNFNAQHNFVPGSNQNIQSPQQFPNQQIFNQQSNMDQYPPQGSFNTGNFNPNLNSGTLDGIPPQKGINGGWNQMQGNQFQNQNSGNQFGMQNTNGNQGFQNQNAGNQFGMQNTNGNQGFQNQNIGNQNAGQFGIQNQNGNQGFQNQMPRDDSYNPVAILGQPVPMTTAVPDGILFTDGSDTPTQKQCVQDCQSTTEYNPVCGSNNVTYFNPGRFICARNCGLGDEPHRLETAY